MPAIPLIVMGVSAATSAYQARKQGQANKQAIGLQQQQLDRQSQRLDQAAARLGRPSGLVARQRLGLSAQAQRLRFAATHALVQRRRDLQQLGQAWPQAAQRGLTAQQQRLERAGLRLQLLDPSLVLQRGYAWLTDEQGRTITRVGQTHAGQALQATLADGKVDLSVTPRGT